MANIGKISISLEAQYATFSQGTQKASKDVAQLGSAANGASGGVGSFLSSLAGGAAIGAGFAVATTAINATIGAIKSGVEAAEQWVATSLKSQQASFRTAEALHIHTATLEGLQMAGRKAGLDNEQFEKALEKVNVRIGEAAQKGGESAETFTKLGLSARTLAGQGLDQSIRQISDAIASIKNPSEQAAAAADIFGQKVGPKLLPLLAQGAKGIDATIAAAKAMGVALDDVDAAKLTAAQRGIDELGERFDGVKNQLAIALAPTIISIGQKILELLPSAKTMQTVFSDVFTNIITFGAGVGDTIAHIAAPLESVNAASARLLATVTTGDLSKFFTNAARDADAMAKQLGDSDLSDKAVKWLQDANNKADKIAKDMAKNLDQPIAALDPAVNEHASKIEEIIKHLQETAASGSGRPKELFDLNNLNASNAQIEQAKKLIDQINQTKIHIEIDKSLEELHKQIATFGMSEGQKKLFDLEAMGATGEHLQLAKDMVAQLEKLEALKKDQEQAKGIIKSSESPVAKYKKQIEDLNRLRDEGLLNQQQYAAAVGKSNKELGDSLKDPYEGRKVGAETRRFDFRGPAAGPPKADPLQTALLNYTKKQADDVAQSKNYLQQIYNITNANNTNDSFTDLGL